jgi:hypothetical protein
MRAAATGVSHFLDQLLRPIFDRAARKSTFVNGIHFVRRMELYRDLGRLSSTTTFITFDVTDLYTMIPRDGALLILERFLLKYANQGRINGMTIDTLMKMARLVLDTNCFDYDDRYYRQIRGGAMGSPFTMTLANIYMLHWEQPLIAHQKLHNELYGRYIDDVFMTSNLPLDQINLLLDEANNRDENIRITRSIDTVVQFLDVSVENKQGRLRTTVHHKPAAEPYIVPFLSDHPRHMHRNVINGALLRAVRLCSDEVDFDEERLDIELMLLLNGYPPRFVSYHFKRFFEKNSAAYAELHHTLIQQPTRRERELEASSNDQQQRADYNKKEILVYLTFESGPKLELKKELRRLWREHYIYPGSPMNNVTLKIGTQSNRSLHQLLVKKKPPRSMLIVDQSTTISESHFPFEENIV